MRCPSNGGMLSRQEENIGPVDEAEIMSQFHHLNELRATGSITEDNFQL
jgi:hypothetical protein